MSRTPWDGDDKRLMRAHQLETCGVENQRVCAYARMRRWREPPPHSVVGACTLGSTLVASADWQSRYISSIPCLSCRGVPLEHRECPHLDEPELLPGCPCEGLHASSNNSVWVLRVRTVGTSRHRMSPQFPTVETLMNAGSGPCISLGFRPSWTHQGLFLVP